MISRMQVAATVADRLRSGRRKAVQEAAAWLVERGKVRDGRYLAHDVATILAGRGYLLVHITAARRLDGSALHKVEHVIKEQTGAKDLELEVIIDPSVIGGLKIETPLAELDNTVRSKMEKLLEGVTSE
jgi:F0F1-type ATP synthase delta subunit